MHSELALFEQHQIHRVYREATKASEPVTKCHQLNLNTHLAQADRQPVTSCNRLNLAAEASR